MNEWVLSTYNSISKEKIKWGKGSKERKLTTLKEKKTRSKKLRLILTSWFSTHDKYVILTYSLFRSWISRIKLVLPRVFFFLIFLLLPCFLLYYQIYQNLTQLSNFSYFFKSIIVSCFFIKLKTFDIAVTSRGTPI